MSTASNQVLSILHINDAVSQGGSLVVMSSLCSASARTNIKCKSLIADAAENLDINLEKKNTYVLRPKYSYPEHRHLITKLQEKNKYLRALGLILFESKRTFFNGLYLLSLIALLKKEKFDVVHIHSTPLPCLACILTKTPFVFHLHGPINSYYTRIGLFMVGRAQTIISISNFVANTATASGLKQHKIKVIANPVRPSPSPADLHHDYKMTPDDVLVGHFGRLVPWKGQLEFIKSFAIALQSTPNMSAIIVGEVTDGCEPYLELLHQTTKELNICDSVYFLGYKTNTEDYYNICDIVVHSSIEPEPFGLVIIEAMAAAKAVIASNLGAAPEIISNGNNGLIADPTNKDDLSSQIVTLASSKALRLQLGEAAKISAEKKYNLDLIAEKFKAVYIEARDKN